MRPKRPASGEKPEEHAPKKQKPFEEVGAALKMLERPILKEEHQELVDAMNIWKEEAELGEEIQKRHAAKPKAQGRWNRKDRAEDEAELMRAAKAARVEVMEKEEEEDYVKDEEEEYVEKEKDGLEEELGEPGGEGHEEERQEQDDEVNPDEMEGGEGQEGHEQPETEENDDDGHQKQAGWWGHGQGWLWWMAAAAAQAALGILEVQAEGLRRRQGQGHRKGEVRCLGRRVLRRWLQGPGRELLRAPLICFDQWFYFLVRDHCFAFLQRASMNLH